MTRIRQVRRADGTLVAFKERKIADAIARALSDAGASDRGLAYELAGVVSLFLSRTFEGVAPTTSDVRAVLGQVLRETGHEEAAHRFERALEEREHLEAELTVRYPRGEEEGPLTEDGSEEVAPWSRLRMVAGLTRTREIPEALAEQITAAVETRLVCCGYRSVTRSFLSEMVEQELLEQGLDGVRERSAAYGVSRATLRELTAPGAESSSQSLDRRLAGTVLKAHALTELHSSRVVGAHREGSIFIHGLDDPYKVERLVLPLSTLLTGFDQDPLRGLLALRGHLDALRQHVRGAIDLPDLVPHLARQPQAAESPERLAQLLLRSLDWRDAFSRPLDPVLGLEIPLGLPAPEASGLDFLRALLAIVERVGPRPGGLAVSFGVPGADVPVDDGLLGRALSFASEGPGCALKIHRGAEDSEPASRLVPLQLSLGRIVLNLPLALADVTHGGLKDVLAALEVPGAAALQALRERFWLQREGRPQGLHGLVVRLGGPGRVQVRADGQEVDLELWGLPFALELLIRRGVIDSARVTDVAARILGYLDYLFGGEWEGVRFRVMLGGVTERPVRRHLFETSVGWAERYGSEDLGRVLRNVPAGRGTLPVAVPLFAERNAPLLRAGFAGRIGPGLALSSSVLKGADLNAAFLARLQEETSLGLLTLSTAQDGEDLFEVQEILFD